MASRKTKIIFGSGALIVVLLASGYGAFKWFRYSKEYERIRSVAFRLNELEERQKRFVDSPEIGDCLKIVEGVGFGLKEYSRAIEYGERCLKLSRPKEKLDWLIHFWLADFYNRTNDTGRAKEHLAIAVRLDKNKMITENGWIETEGLKAIYASIQPYERSVTSVTK